MDEVIKGWRKLHNEELHNLCSSNFIGMIESGGWDGRGLKRALGAKKYVKICMKSLTVRELKRWVWKWKADINMDRREEGFGVQTGCIWLSLGSSGVLVWIFCELLNNWVFCRLLKRTLLRADSLISQLYSECKNL
jgi:hypothetical protein